ncbi:YciI family protein [Actinoplanes sp. CA-142083]|uniref:YciI family protein n=1 Tax=Actinoplanes sp. CA-142083 TaxID=3239903 RepID=UPI003D911773
MKLAVVLYQTADDFAAKATALFPAHKARLDEFHASGDLLMVGTFDNIAKDGSMAVFASRAAAEKFVDGDPFLLNGVVRSHEIRDWNEIYS